MIAGPCYAWCIGITLVLLPVAFNTVFPRHYYLSMSWWNRGGSIKDKVYKEFILLRDAQVMAFMTVYSCMLALLPGCKGWFHQMAAYAEFGIILCEVIKSKGNIATAYQDNQGKDSYYYLSL